MSDETKKPALLQVPKPAPATEPETQHQTSNSDPQNHSSNASYSTIDGDVSDGHFDEFTVDEEAIAPEDLPGGKTGKLDIQSGETVLSQDEFCQMMAGTFAFAGGATGLETLAQAAERDTAQPAFATLWEIAYETPSMRWLIEPQSVWLQRTVTIGAFAIPTARAVAGEVNAKRKPKAKPKPVPAHAAGNNSGGFGDDFTA